jgi:hypothetical protein
VNVHLPRAKQVTVKKLLGHGLRSEYEKQQAWEQSIKAKLDKKNIN